MNYYEIGQRIRKIRKAYGLSQEELAAKVDISITHMSHIETGNTKLSLPVLVDIALVLSVGTDTLLFGESRESITTISEEVQELLERCSIQQAKIVLDIAKATKLTLDKNI